MPYSPYPGYPIRQTTMALEEMTALEAAVATGPGGIIPDTGGVKHDADKPRHDLIPPELPDAVARVLTFGAAKYGDRNWEKGMRWGRPFAALMRHMWEWWRGSPADPETGMSHLWHAACCLTFLIAYEQRKIGEDDREVLDQVPNKP